MTMKAPMSTAVTFVRPDMRCQVPLISACVPPPPNAPVKPPDFLCYIITTAMRARQTRM